MNPRKLVAWLPALILPGATTRSASGTFGFPLVDANDLDEAIREVEAAGGKLIEKTEIGGGLPTAFVSDPDGYRIQL